MIRSIKPIIVKNRSVYYNRSTSAVFGDRSGDAANAIDWSRTAVHEGTTHLLFNPEEFLEKLAAIIPPPKNHLVRWSGVFAAGSRLRQKIILKPDKKKGFEFSADGKKVKNKSWSLMLVSTELARERGD